MNFFIFVIIVLGLYAALVASNIYAIKTAKNLLKGDDVTLSKKIFLIMPIILIIIIACIIAIIENLHP